MTYFFNNTATDQHHDHDHDPVGSDVDPNAGNNSSSESMHDNQERNQHKPQKESKDMNRIIKNSIAPILLGFAVSMIFLFSLSPDARGFERADFNGDGFRVDATKDFNLDTSSYDRDAWVDKNVELVRFNGGREFRFTDRNFARAGVPDFNDFKDNRFGDFDGDKFARRDFDRITDGNGDIFADFDNQNVRRYGDGIYVDANNDDGVRIRDRYLDLGFKGDDVGDIDADSFGRRDFAF